MKLDILVLSAHPDDAELGCGGTIALHVALGKAVGMVDFTRGELGTRGNAHTREQEAQAAAQILGLKLRQNLEMADGFFEINREHKMQVIEVIRRFRPEIVLGAAPLDRHPDHSRAAELIRQACFLAGLSKIITYDPDGYEQSAWRPRHLFHFIQDYSLNPSFVVDISAYWDIKLEAVQAFKTQFYHPEADMEAPQTPISSPDFIHFLEGRAREMGRMIGTTYGEGFIKASPPGVRDLFQLL
ncbi:MAG: bacillithiol biosynthesis deacetylase BshB1 [Microscillaceae bacterium]|nr:bacillithiol biosynthesis deacetylase BshB1 [Microscillaceae bacterium]